MRRIPFSWLFGGGMVLGMLYISTGGRLQAGSFPLPDPEWLERINVGGTEKKELLQYLLTARIKTVLIPAVLGTTYLGLAAIRLQVIEFGACGGILLSVCLSRYGLKGIGLMAVGLLPQYVLYLPAAVWLFGWSSGVCTEIYFQKQLGRDVKRWGIRRLLQFLAILVIVIIGCFLETYVNPLFLQKVIKNF